MFCLPVGLVHRFVSKKLVYSCGFWNLGPNTQNSWLEATLLNNTVKLDHLSGFPGEQLKKDMKPPPRKHIFSKFEMKMMVFEKNGELLWVC